MMRAAFTFFSLLAFGAITAAGLAALIPWATGRVGSGLGGNGLAGQSGLQLESLLLGLALGLFLGIIGRYHWADIPRRIVTWFLIRERQFFYYSLIASCIVVLLFY